MAAFQGMMLSVFILSLTILCSGCVTDQDSPGIEQSFNKTAAAIEIALSNETVQTYLKGDWRIMGVSLDATVSFPANGDYITLNAPDVKIETESEVVHAYIDLSENCVIDIWVQTKRVPMP